MVLPLGPMGMGMGFGAFGVAAPPVIKDYYAKYWWFMAALLFGICFCEIIAMEIFDAIFSCILLAMVIVMAKNDCDQMSPHCLAMFGIICAVQAIFETIALLGSVHGRRISHTIRSPIDKSEMTMTTTIEMHPFFDPSETLVYNMQSAIKIAYPAAMVFGTILCYVSYKAFDSAVGDLEGLPVNGGAFQGPRHDMYGAAGAEAGDLHAGNTYGAPPPARFQGAPRRLVPSQPPGSGKRAGDRDASGLAGQRRQTPGPVAPEATPQPPADDQRVAPPLPVQEAQGNVAQPGGQRLGGAGSPVVFQGAGQRLGSK
jgi:hypothetical protein